MSKFLRIKLISFKTEIKKSEFELILRTVQELPEPVELPLYNWNMEVGYGNQDLSQSYPYRVFGTGFPSSLMVNLRMYRPNFDRMCDGPVQGFKIMFHKPNEGAQPWKRYSFLSPGTTKTFLISPQLKLAMENIRKYSPNVRECFFDVERPLRFFKQYTHVNCEMECLANFTLNQCGCVKMSMPRKQVVYKIKEMMMWQENFDFF